MKPHRGAKSFRPAVPGRAVVLILGLLILPIAAGADTGLPIPRYASLRADEVNMRTGPGVRYPVDWVFVKRDLPLLITAEFGTWRKVRDWQGTEGWIHQSMLSGRRTVMVVGGMQAMRREPRTDAPVVAKVEERVLARLLSCAEAWCQVEIVNYRGWIARDHIWGVLRGENGDFQ